MDVLLSVKPHFAERIFDGTKKYEYRKTIFSRTDVQKVIIYASSPVKKIVGEFQIAEIIQDKPEFIWLRTHIFSGVHRDFFFQYFTGKDSAYAINIKHYQKYDAPVNPWDILPNFTPPQSFKYIDSKNLFTIPTPRGRRGVTRQSSRGASLKGGRAGQNTCAQQGGAGEIVSLRSQ